MPSERETLDSVRFGRFSVSIETGELRKDGIRLKLSGQAIQVLALLAANPGKLVTREELQQKLWPGNIYGDPEHGLNAAVNKLRETLGDSATEPTYIETIPGRGYRFIAKTAEVPSATSLAEPENAVQIASPEQPAAPAHVSAARARVGSRFAALAVILCIVAVGSYLAWKLLLQPTPELHAVPFNALPGSAFPGSFSPDGQQIVFNWDQNKGSFGVFVQMVGEEQPHLIAPGSDRMNSPAWSRDGKWIAFLRPNSLSDSHIVRVPALGGHEVVLERIGPGCSYNLHSNQPVWSSDATSFVLTGSANNSEQTAIHMLRLHDLKDSRLTMPPAGSIGDSAPALSPDGKEIAFVRTLSQGVSQIAVLTSDSENVRSLGTVPGNISGLTWDEVGRDLIYSSDKSGIYRLWRISARGGISRLIDVGEDAVSPIVSARSHRLAYAREHVDNNIWRVRFGEQGNGEARDKLIASSRLESQPVFSPDDRKITFISDRSGAPEVWVSNADGSDPVRLTDIGNPVTGSPTWSPDGRLIAFDSRLRGHSDIYVVGMDGAKARRVTDDGFDNSDPSWSADGRWIYYSSSATGSWQIWKVPLDGGQAIQVTREGGAWPAFEGVDGSTLYYLKFKDSIDLFQKFLPNGEERRFTHIPPLAFWNGWQLAKGGIYFAPRGPETESAASPSDIVQEDLVLQYFDFATKVTTPVTRLRDALARPGGFTVSKDGRTILYVQTDSIGAEIMLVENFH
jgi:Tol biopolymer transport system component/DNA-binding winged helix-turn-helix (wHTH) protein